MCGVAYPARGVAAQYQVTAKGTRYLAKVGDRCWMVPRLLISSPFFESSAWQ